MAKSKAKRIGAGGWRNQRKLWLRINPAKRNFWRICGAKAAKSGGAAEISAWPGGGYRGGRTALKLNAMANAINAAAAACRKAGEMKTI